MLPGAIRRVRSLAGLLAVVAMMVGQLALGGSLPRADLATLLSDSSAICHSGEAPAGGDRDEQPRHRDCAICPLCLSLSAPAAALAACPALPEPTSAGFWHPGTDGRATPVLVRLALHAQPRGPPPAI